MRKIHFVKTWTGYFDDVDSGKKTWELRINDRNYQVGDLVVLMRYDIKLKTYTGHMIEIEITYLYEGNQFGLIDGWCIFSHVKTGTNQKTLEKMIEKYNAEQRGVSLNF